MNGLDRTVVIESSIVARSVRRAFTVGRRAMAPQGGRQIPAAVDEWQVVEGSRLVMRVESMLGVIGTAWRDTLATGLLKPVARDLQALEPAERVRLIGWMLFVAALMTGAWRAQDRFVSWSILLSVVTMLTGGAVMKWSASIVAAWADRSKNRP